MLVRELMRRQEGEGLTDEEFGAKLGISRQAWSLIHNRQRSPSVAVLRGALAAYPDLAGATLQYLQTANAEEVRGDDD